MKKSPIILSAGIVLLFFSMGISGYSDTSNIRKNRNSTYYPMADLKPVEYKGQIVSIDKNDRYIVINQILIHVVSNMVLKDGTTLSTECVDQNGNTVPFSTFQNYQRVKVWAYRASDHYTFAVKIQRQNRLPKDRTGPSPLPQ